MTLKKSKWQMSKINKIKKPLTKHITMYTHSVAVLIVQHRNIHIKIISLKIKHTMDVRNIQDITVPATHQWVAVEFQFGLIFFCDMVC